MQFGIFSVGDVTTDPTTGRTPTEHERIKAQVEIALKARRGRARRRGLRPAPQPAVRGLRAHDDDGLGRPPRPGASSSRRRRRSSRRPTPCASPRTTPRSSTSSTDGWTSCSGRGNTGPVYPWFGKDIRDGIGLAVENYALLHRLWREDDGGLGGSLPDTADGLHLDAPPARRRAAVRVARLDPQPSRSRSRPRTTATASSPTTSSGRPSTPSAWSASTGSASSTTGTAAADQAIVGLGRTHLHAPEQPGRHPGVPTLLRQRPGLRPRALARGRSWRKRP